MCCKEDHWIHCRRNPRISVYICLEGRCLLIRCRREFISVSVTLLAALPDCYVRCVQLVCHAARYGTQTLLRTVAALSPSRARDWSPACQRDNYISLPTTVNQDLRGSRWCVLIAGVAVVKIVVHDVATFAKFAADKSAGFPSL